MSLPPQTTLDFDRARFKAFLNEVAALVARRPNELISFDQVRTFLKPRGTSYRGVQTVPIANIIGSATQRYADFDRAFLPAQSHTRTRWQRVDAAYYEGVELPPVELYQVGEVYFVRDGHHRVSVAREKGQEFIEAQVIQVQTRVPVTTDLNADDLEIVGEYADFLEKTRLDQLRPAQQIRFSQAGGYDRLVEHISVHRYFLGLEQNRQITRDEAVGSWYDNVYLPIVELIRDREILRDFPGRTEADLYLWITEHHYFLHERDENVDFESAAEDFAEHYSQRLDKKIGRGLRHAFAEWFGDQAVSRETEAERAEDASALNDASNEGTRQ
jgi:hypothetical protein